MLTPTESWHKNQVDWRKFGAIESASPWERSFGLWSLLAMIKTYAHQLAEVAVHLSTYPIGLAGLHLAGTEEVPEFFVNEVRKEAEAAKLLCSDLGMRASLIQIDRLLNDLPHHGTNGLAMAVKETASRIIDELSGIWFFHVPSQRVEFYNKPWCGETVESAFPKAINDIREAGRAYALGRWTASVFHAMGILQRGLYALAADVGVEFKAGFELENWKNIIDSIQKKIDQLLADTENKAKSASKDESLTFYSRVAMEFQYFKNAWRNHVAHLRESYDEEQANVVLAHVKQFMQRLSERLVEKP